MDPDLERYLLAIVLVLSLLAGLLATQLVVSAVSVSATFFFLPVVLGLIVFGASIGVAGSLVAMDRGQE